MFVAVQSPFPSVPRNPRPQHVTSPALSAFPLPSLFHPIYQASSRPPFQLAIFHSALPFFPYSSFPTLISLPSPLLLPLSSLFLPIYQASPLPPFPLSICLPVHFSFCPISPYLAPYSLFSLRYSYCTLLPLSYSFT